MSPDDFLYDFESDRVVGYVFRRDVSEEDFFNMGEQKRDDAPFALEVAIDGSFGNADFFSDPFYSQVFAAVFENQDRGSIDDLLLSYLCMFSFLYQDTVSGEICSGWLPRRAMVSYNC